MRKAQPVNPQQYALPNSKVPFLAPEVLTKVIPSPVEGWDSISPLAEMDPKRAPILQNWVPRPGFVELRGGSISYSGTQSGFTEPVESLITYRPALGPQNLFAASGQSVFDATVGGQSTLVLSGLSNARWQYTNFASGGGIHVLQMANGADPIHQWDGTTWTTPAITGLPAGNVISVVAIKQRLWYIIDNSTVFSFLATGAITGAIAGSQDLGTLWNKGGFLQAMGEWTIDGGSGPQSYVIFISSQGQCSLYAGTDPTNSTAWSLVGTFDLAPPIGRRCLLRIGSDLAIITKQGVIPISQALPFDPSADRSASLTARIQNATTQSAMLYSSQFGWEMITYPFQQLLILNVPIAENVQQQQYVMNTLTGAWCNFTGWNANCFTIFNDNLYFGGNNGDVNQAYVGGDDIGTPIQADMQCAFNWLDEPGRTKRMTMVQPLLTLSGELIPTIAIDTDFTTSTSAAPITQTLKGSALWDVAVWDLSKWPLPTVSFSKFLSVSAIGHAMAIRLRANISSSTIVTSPARFDIAKFDQGVFAAGSEINIPVIQVNAFNSIAELGGAI